jgi:hypothetical protein
MLRLALTCSVVVCAGWSAASADAAFLWSDSACGGPPGEGNAFCATIAPVSGDESVLTLFLAPAAARYQPTSFTVESATDPTVVKPTGVCSQDGTGSGEDLEGEKFTYFTIRCNEKLDAGGSLQLCVRGAIGLYANRPTEGPYISAGYFDENATVIPSVSSCSLGGGGAGSNSAACVVPNVKGKSLAAAEKAIKHAHCAVGSVTRRKSGSVGAGRVIAQDDAAGRKLTSASNVSLMVSTG